MYSKVEQIFHSVLTAVDFCSLRLVDERGENLAVRQNVLEPVGRSSDTGVMVTVIDGDGLGYGATS